MRLNGLVSGNSQTKVAESRSNRAILKHWQLFASATLFIEFANVLENTLVVLFIKAFDNVNNKQQISFSLWF